MIFDKLGRQVREFTLPFLIGVGGPEKVRELKALRALKESPTFITPEDLKYLGDMGHTEEAADGVRFSPRGRQRWTELEALAKTTLSQGNPAPNLTTPPAGALPGDASALRMLSQPGAGLPTTRIPNASRGALPAPGLLDTSPTGYKNRKTEIL